MAKKIRSLGLVTCAMRVASHHATSSLIREPFNPGVIKGSLSLIVIDSFLILSQILSATSQKFTQFMAHLMADRLSSWVRYEYITSKIEDLNVFMLWLE